MPTREVLASFWRDWGQLSPKQPRFIVDLTEERQNLMIPAYPGGMRHLSSLLLAIAVAVALPAASAATASAASPEEGAVVLVELTLQTNNGLNAHLENSEDGTVILEVSKEGQSVRYLVPGEVSEEGLKARFGRLGLIDVAFTPTKTLNSTEPGKGCTGASRTLREGVFAGTINFTGEREFVRIEGPQATGSMSVISRWECPKKSAMNPDARVSRTLAAAPRNGKGKREAATLAAMKHGFSSYFVAGVAHRHSGGKSIFLGARIEGLDDVLIWRTTVVHGPASAFDFDFDAGTATLRPPAPLRGHASFSAHSRGRSRWRSTIRVPLLGADPIDTRRPAFKVTLRPEYQF
jgi:hypothetical protein